MNTMKKQWETPRTEFEGFVPNMYCVNCDGLGHWETVMDPQPFHPSTKFYIDDNGNKRYEEGVDKRVTTANDNPGGLTADKISYGWVEGQTSGEPNIAFINKNQSVYYAYHIEDVWFATEKS